MGSTDLQEFHEHETYVSRTRLNGVQRIHKRRLGSRAWGKAVIAIAVFHIGMTLAYLAAPLGPLRPLVNAYMEPVFKQSWYVFAPDPGSRNPYLEVRAKKADGTVSGWFNISTCDTESAVRHHLIPNRRYLTSFQLVRHYEIERDNMPAAAKNVLERDFSGSGWQDQLKADLRQVGTPAQNVASFTKNDFSTVNFVSSIARARWGKVKAVQIRIRSVYTRPFAERNTDQPLKVDVWQTGYVPASPPNAGIDADIAELYSPKAGC